jgi:ubiquinone/menaquinone biosynthesis C-methylase UbiE
MVSEFKTQEDWTSLEIGRFWDWMERTKKTPYFSEELGTGLIRFFKKKVSLRGDILDFGCGTGYLLSLIAKEKGVTVSGLDFSERSVIRTKERLSKEGNVGQILFTQDLPSEFPDNHFDLIFLIETIEHLNDHYLYNVLTEIRRLLKVNGKVVITTPFNEDLGKNSIYCPFCNSEFHHMQHMRSFTLQSMDETLKRFGLSVIECTNDDLYKYQFPFRYYLKEIGKVFLNRILKLNKPPFLKPNLIAIASKST